MAVYSVGQVHQYLKDVLGHDPVVQDLWVRGEVGNLARPGSGHTYFSLRESNATLRSVMFRGSVGAELLEEGAAVVAHGRVAIYEVRGDLQLIVDIVQPEGVGELQLKLEELKLKLETEGLFEPSRKRPLPAFPRRVGVATSPTGAVWHDVRTVIQRRYPLVELLLAPCSVQGEGAAATIVESVEALNDTEDLDVMIVARGGGSLEDLWSFNDETVARAIFKSRVPVISAVGHETDVTIADMVADQRAPTPSAAAELAVPDRIELASGVSVSKQLITASVTGRVRDRKETVAALVPRLNRTRPDLDQFRMRIDDLLTKVAGSLRWSVAFKTEGFRGLEGRLSSLNPKDTLRRGYAIVQTRADGAVVSDPSTVSVGERLKVTVAKGDFEADVAESGRDDQDSDGTTE